MLLQTGLQTVDARQRRMLRKTLRKTLLLQRSATQSGIHSRIKTLFEPHQLGLLACQPQLRVLLLQTISK